MRVASSCKECVSRDVQFLPWGQTVCGSLQSRFVSLSKTKSCLCICVVIMDQELVFLTQELCFWQGKTKPSCLEPLSCGSGLWLCAGKFSVHWSLSDLSPWSPCLMLGLNSNTSLLLLKPWANPKWQERIRGNLSLWIGAAVLGLCSTEHQLLLTAGY